MVVVDLIESLSDLDAKVPVFVVSDHKVLIVDVQMVIDIHRVFQVLEVLVVI